MNFERELSEFKAEVIARALHRRFPDMEISRSLVLEKLMMRRSVEGVYKELANELGRSKIQQQKAGTSGATGSGGRLLARLWNWLMSFWQG